MQRKFFTDLYSKEEADVIVFGAKMDENSSTSINSIRYASWFVELFDVDKKRNLFDAKIADMGDIDVKNLDDIKNTAAEISKQNKVPLMLSYSHLPTLFSFSAMPKNTKLIVFDAHSDMSDEYNDEKITGTGLESPKVNGSTWLRRVAEKINPENIFLVGVRSLDEDIFKFIQEKKINFVTANSLKINPNEARTALWHFTQDNNVYISVDIDVFDPSIAPAVDYPEPAGILFQEFQQLISEINGKIVGIDMCCLKPIPNNEVTGFLAVKSIFEILDKI